MKKSLIYSLRYMLIISLFYYIFKLDFIYNLSFTMVAIIPVNFLAIHYGILYQINKENYVTKYYILISLIVFTTLFNLIFLSLNKVHFIVVVFTIFINALELIYLDIPRIKEKKKNNKKK